MTENGRTELSVLVVRSGGILGAPRRWAVQPRSDAPAWLALIEACPWDAVKSDEVSRDRFVWRIEARTPQGQCAASVPDRDLTGPWRELVDRVRQAADD
ncbi:MAG TPA: hypothetical protein VN759_06960 [Pseudolysinimonas sp.]|nr:hypothetical protein [Pseudolysinimonas sp.]